MNAKQLRIASWGLSAAVSIIAVIAWGQSFDWKFGVLTTYSLFPLFGLLAFSLMWSHYIASVMRQYFKLEKNVISRYFEITSGMVLVFILLHPGLLGWQLWRDGLGLPPTSYKAYIGPALYGSLLLGAMALVVFLAYEFHRKFKERSWWKFVEYASDGAMLLVFYHALQLGGQLQRGWFKGIWYVYGATLILSLIYIYDKKIDKPETVKK